MSATPDQPTKTHAHGFFEKIGIENHNKIFSNDEDMNPDAIESQVRKHYTNVFLSNPDVINPIKQSAISELEKRIDDNLRAVFLVSESELKGLDYEQKLKLAQSKQNQALSQTENQRVLKIQELEASAMVHEERMKNLETNYQSQLSQMQMQMYVSQVAGSKQLTNELKNVLPALMLELNSKYQMNWEAKTNSVQFLTKTGAVVLNDKLKEMTAQDIIVKALADTNYIVVNKAAGNQNNIFNGGVLTNLNPTNTQNPNQNFNANQNANAAIANNHSLQKALMHEQNMRAKFGNN